MPSVEPTSATSTTSHPVDQSEQQTPPPTRSEQQDSSAPPHQNGHQQTVNGADPDRQLIPADRIEHVEDCEAPIDLPTVREFTQNDKINKFLLNSFLQRINETDLGPASNSANGDGPAEPDQDFEA